MTWYLSKGITLSYSMFTVNEILKSKSRKETLNFKTHWQQPL